jgi:hypothetical protein
MHRMMSEMNTYISCSSDKKDDNSEKEAVPVFTQIAIEEPFLHQ